MTQVNPRPPKIEVQNSDGEVTARIPQQLPGKDLEGCDLSGHDLYQAQLQGRNLKGAILYWGSLWNANLDGRAWLTLICAAQIYESRRSLARI